MYLILAEILGFVAIALFVVAVVQVAKKRKALNVVSASRESIKAIPDFRCPKCGSLMEDGFLHIRGIARWRDFNSSPGAFTNSGGNIENFAQEPDAIKLTLGVPENIAKRCRRCALMLVDHSSHYKIER